MHIFLKKFGANLISRQFGKEALAAFMPSLGALKKEDEILLIDFDGVDVFSPSWGDEFLTPLIDKYKEKVQLKNTKNASVQATLGILEEIHKYKFNNVN